MKVEKKNIFKKIVEDQNISPTDQLFESTVESELKKCLTAAGEDLLYVFLCTTFRTTVL